MNLSQVFSVARWAIALGAGFAAGYAAGHGWSGTTAVGMVVAAWPFVWGILSHTDAAKLDAVANMPAPAKDLAFRGVSVDTKLKAVEELKEVEAVIVSPTAKNGLAKAAADDTRPKIRVV